MDKLKKFFLWLFTTIGLVLTITGSVQFLNLGLKTYVFTKADYNYCRSTPVIEPNGKVAPVENDDYQKQCEEQREANRQSQASTASALLIVGLPIFGTFLRLARRD